MKLNQWITDLTPPKVAELLDADLNTVYQWRDLKNLPKDEMKLKIVKITHGLVSYAEMIEPFFDARNR